MEGITAQLASVRQRLGKKKEFERAVRELASLFSRYDSLEASAQDELRSLLSRAHVLLQTRYTGRPFWMAGEALFEVAVGALGDSPAEHREAAGRALARAREELGDGGAPAAAPAAGDGDRFVFAGRGPPPPQREWDPLDVLVASLSGADVRQLIDAASAPLINAAVAGAEAARAAEDGEGGPAAEGGGGAAEGGERGEPGSPGPSPAAEELRRWSEGGDASVAAALRRVAELGAGLDSDVIPGLEEVINATIEEAAENASAGPPPASRAAVRALRTDAVTAERLAELGEGVECAVCREALQEGEEVQVMPCNDHHVYHPPCLKPWLDKHNSCPVCRFELPTDDHEYERRKEVAKEREEERRGVENALPGGEFMFM